MLHISNDQNAGGRPARRATGAITKSGGRIDIDPAASQSGQETADQMANYAITRVPADYFHYREFRYTNLKDAIAQAKTSVHI